MPPYPLTNFELQQYYQNEPKFNCVYSKDGAYVLNLDEYESVETHWRELYINCDKATYLDSFGVESIPKEIKKFVDNKNIRTNIYRIQVHSSIMYRYFLYWTYSFHFKR